MDMSSLQGISNYTSPQARTEGGSPAQAQLQAAVRQAAQSAAGLPELLMFRQETVQAALEHLGFMVMPENIALAETLLDGGFAVSRENMNLLRQAQKLVSLTPEKAVFFLQNDIKPGIKNAELFNMLRNGELDLPALADSILSEAALVETEGKLQQILSALPDDVPQIPAETLLNAALELADTDAPTDVKRAALETMLAELSAEPALNDGTETQVQGETGENIQKSVKAEHSETIIKAAIKTLDQTETAGKELAQLIKQLPDGGNDLEDLLSKPEFKRELVDKVINLRDDSPETALLLEIADTPNSTETHDAKPRDKAFELIIKAAAEELPPDKAEKLLELANLDAKDKPALTKGRLDPEKYELEKFPELIKHSLDKARGLTESAADTAAPRQTQSRETAELFQKGLDFISQMRGDHYYQLPIRLHNQDLMAELHVFAGKKREKKSIATALLAVDMANLGRVEAVIVRDGTNIDCRFGLEDAKTEKLIKSHLPKLSAMLAEKGFRLTAATRELGGEKFRLGDPNPDGEKAGSRTEGFDIKV